MIEELEAAVGAVCEADPATLADGDAVLALHRCLARLEAATTRAAAAFDANGAWEACGARTAAAWLAVRAGLPRPTAARRMALGRALRHMPAAEGAWLAGRVGEAQVSLLARARTPRTEGAMARDEAMLVERAGELRFDRFARVLAYWSQCADPDGAEDDALAQRGRRSFHLSRSFEGMWFGDLVLDPIGGAVVSGALEAVEAELFAADWAEAKERIGEGATVEDLARTPAQRRADALVELARRAGTAPPDGRRPDPLFTVLVDYQTLAGRVCELVDGTVVSPGSLVPWLGQAWVQRVVFDSENRVLDVGVSRRVFDGATRLAVQVRDRECFHELCDLPAQQCQIDHVIPWSAGGRTEMANGRPACGFHNRQRHQPRPTHPPPARE